MPILLLPSSFIDLPKVLLHFSIRFAKLKSHVCFQFVTAESSTCRWRLVWNSYGRGKGMRSCHDSAGGDDDSECGYAKVRLCRKMMGRSGRQKNWKKCTTSKSTISLIESTVLPIHFRICGRFATFGGRPLGKDIILV